MLLLWCCFFPKLLLRDDRDQYNASVLRRNVIGFRQSLKLMPSEITQGQIILHFFSPIDLHNRKRGGPLSLSVGEKTSEHRRMTSVATVAPLEAKNQSTVVPKDGWESSKSKLKLCVVGVGGSSEERDSLRAVAEGKPNASVKKDQNSPSSELDKESSDHSEPLELDEQSVGDEVVIVGRATSTLNMPTVDDETREEHFSSELSWHDSIDIPTQMESQEQPFIINSSTDEQKVQEQEAAPPATPQDDERKFGESLTVPLHAEEVNIERPATPQKDKSNHAPSLAPTRTKEVDIDAAPSTPPQTDEAIRELPSTPLYHQEDKVEAAPPLLYYPPSPSRRGAVISKQAIVEDMVEIIQSSVSFDATLPTTSGLQHRLHDKQRAKKRAEKEKIKLKPFPPPREKAIKRGRFLGMTPNEEADGLLRDDPKAGRNPNPLFRFRKQ